MKRRPKSAITPDIPRERGGMDPRCDRVADLLEFTGDRHPPQVGPDAPIGEVVETLSHHRHSQRVYVVDPLGTLLGTVSVRTLARHIFSHGHEPRVHPRRMLSALTSETASHLMQEGRVVVLSTDGVEEVIRAMMGHHSEEAAVVDANGRLMGDLTMTDLLLFCQPGSAPPAAGAGTTTETKETE